MYTGNIEIGGTFHHLPIISIVEQLWSKLVHGIFLGLGLPILERRIKELAEENKQLHAEATELANEAKECEEKEEKLG